MNAERTHFSDAGQDHEPEEVIYGVSLSVITPAFISEIVQLYLETACTYPEYYTHPDWTGGVGYSPETAAAKIIDDLTSNTGDTSMLCSFFDMSDEGVFFRKVWDHTDNCDTDIISIQYYAGDLLFSTVRGAQEEIEKKRKRFTEAVQGYLSKTRIGVPLPK